MSHLHRSHRPRLPDRRGFTVIEVLEFFLATLLAQWLAGRIAGGFPGVWKPIVFWSTTLVGTVAIGLAFMLGLSRLTSRHEPRGSEFSPSESDGPAPPRT